MAAASVADSAASGPRLRRTYSSMWAGEDLDEEYGSVTGGPSKNRRAGVSFRIISQYHRFPKLLDGEMCGGLYPNVQDNDRSWIDPTLQASSFILHLCRDRMV